MPELSEAQRALVRLIANGVGSPRHITRQDARRRGMESDFDIARREGLLVSAGYECSVAGDDFLNSEVGRSALQETVDG